MVSLVKTGEFLPSHKISSGLETDLFVFDNELYELTEVDKVLRIYKISDGSLVSTFGENIGLASTIMVNGVLYILATTNWNNSNNTLKMYKTSDLINLEFVQNLITGPNGETFFNSSIVMNPTNGNEFMVAIEQRRSSDPTFTAFFMRSTTGIEGTFSIHGSGVYGTGDQYMAACPTIMCTTTGEYYCTFLERSIDDSYSVPLGYFFTKMVKMNSFNGTWQGSTRPMLVAEGNEGINNSDLSMTEFNGKLYMSYSCGNQLTWGDKKLAIFDGTIDELVYTYWQV